MTPRTRGQDTSAGEVAGILVKGSCPPGGNGVGAASTSARNLLQYLVPNSVLARTLP
jgi:hypothetical protein